MQLKPIKFTNSTNEIITLDITFKAGVATGTYGTISIPKNGIVKLYASKGCILNLYKKQKNDK